VRSRTIWNQHAYHVTHVNEDGTIPQTSLWEKNWLAPELNNFRQNVPGDTDALSVPDTTAGASVFMTCNGAAADLHVDICNRGAAPQGAGVVVGFYVGGISVCETSTTQALAPDECQSVSCVWDDPPETSTQAIDVDVVANDGGAVSECKENNNAGVIQGVFCTPPQ